LLGVRRFYLKNEKLRRKFKWTERHEENGNKGKEETLWVIGGHTLRHEDLAEKSGHVKRQKDKEERYDWGQRSVYRKAKWTRDN